MCSYFVLHIFLKSFCFSLCFRFLPFKRKKIERIRKAKDRKRKTTTLRCKHNNFRQYTGKISKAISEQVWQDCEQKRLGSEFKRMNSQQKRLKNELDKNGGKPKKL